MVAHCLNRCFSIARTPKKTKKKTKNGNIDNAGNWILSENRKN